MTENEEKIGRRKTEEGGGGVLSLQTLPCYRSLVVYVVIHGFISLRTMTESILGKVHFITLIYRCDLSFNLQPQNQVLDTHFIILIYRRDPLASNGNLLPPNSSSAHIYLLAGQWKFTVIQIELRMAYSRSAPAASGRARARRRGGRAAL
jgi:hypothetical protein